jgi:hypothetical protein
MAHIQATSARAGSYIQRCRAPHGYAAREAPEEPLLVLLLLLLHYWRRYVRQEERRVLINSFFVALKDRDDVVKLRSSVWVGRPALCYQMAYCHRARSGQWRPSILHHQRLLCYKRWWMKVVCIIF